MAEISSMEAVFGNPFKEKYHYDRFEFEGKIAYVIFPPKGTANGSWILKTEYFGCFPDLEMYLLDKGFYVAGVNNRGRWMALDDVEHQAAFIRYVAEKYGLSQKCIPFGMSAGGGMALMIAGTHPELVSLLYLDAAVYNLFSVPYGYGKSTCAKDDAIIKEITEYYGKSPVEMLSYRNAPIDYTGQILEARIPAVFVYGTSDFIVPFDENCGILLNLYESNGIDHIVIKKENCAHHPHGVPNKEIVADFIMKHA